jgi:lipoprotein NlpI
LCAVATTVSAASKKDWDDCQADDPDRSIAGCTRIIQSRSETPKNRAIAYYNRGIAYSDKGDHDRAITEYNEAIRLNPSYVAAYNNRGNSYNRKGEYRRALQDYDKALQFDPKYARGYNNKGEVYENLDEPGHALEAYSTAIDLDPKYARAYSNRGDINLYRGKFDLAISDYTRALELDSKRTDSYRNRAIAQLFNGEAAKALADITEANERDSASGYNALWLDIIGDRNNAPSALVEGAKKIDLKAWPGPVVSLFLGQSTVDATIEAADNPRPKTKRDRTCDAVFFSGEVALRTKQKDDAIKLFRRAVNECAHASVGFGVANAELKALGETP